MVTSTAERISFLRNELNRHNELYYKHSSPQITDYEYDQLMAELIQLEEANPSFFDPTSPSLRVGSDISNNFEQKTHLSPMLSLSNTYTEGEIRDFVDRCQRSLGEDITLCAELKFDGTSISLTYQDGVLQQAVTRGDGEKGDDVTTNVRTIRNIPLRIDDTHLLEIRGEIVLPWTEFDRINAERADVGDTLFANPRNAASGTLKQLSSKVVASRKLDALFYSLQHDDLPYDSHYANLQYLKQLGFHVSEHIQLCTSIDEVMDFIHLWDEQRKALPVATDGIVLKVDSLRQRQELGLTSKFPRWAIAYKFKAEQAASILRAVTFQVGRTGSVTPVANLDPVLLSGTTVRRASLYNEDAILSLDLHIGDTCFVEKGGEIIPKIVGVDKSLRPDGAPAVQFITHCPECGTKLIREEGEAAYFCPNSNHCPPQVQGRIEHFVARRAMNIDGIGPETIQLMLQDGLISNYADLFKLTVDEMTQEKVAPAAFQSELFPVEDATPAKPATKAKRRITKLVAKKIVKAIDASKSIPFERVLFALGIRYVGETVAKKLAFAFHTMEGVMQATYDQLIAVDEIGHRIAISVLDFFAQEENRALIAQLGRADVQFALAEDAIVAPTSTILADTVVVVSGVFHQHSRDEYKSIILQNGGKVGSGITGKTSFVLAGDNMGPAKLEKATKLGVRIVSEDEFLAMLS